MNTDIKKIQVLVVKFLPEISSTLIPAFRGAIAEKAGYGNVLFHNHLDEKNFLFKYPAIQYKTIGRKPAIVSINEGIKDLLSFLQFKVLPLNLNGNVYNFTISDLKVNTYEMRVWNKMMKYRIYKWAALNEKNLKAYNNAGGEEERRKILEKILIANIFSFAKGIDWHIDKHIELKINNINNIRAIKFKAAKKLTFDVSFETNVFLPNFIGLGKAASRGFGIINREIKK